jgi:hypothetical protein
MKTQILLVLFAACIAVLMPTGGANAKAVECNVARPSNADAHWSWRLIDGRKCWYVGKTMISKSLLRWPPKASMQAKAEPKAAPAPVAVATEKRSDPLDAQARLLEYASSFEARWRARAIAD